MAGSLMFSHPKPLIRNPIHLPKRQRIWCCHKHSSRLFSSSARSYQRQTDYKESFGTRLRRSLRDTKIQWYPIPVGLGIGFLGLAQLYKINEREKAKEREKGLENDESIKGVGSGGNIPDKQSEGRPKRRHRIRPTGPWYDSAVHVVPMITDMMQASPSYVNSPFESHVQIVGQIQRTGDTILFTCAWFQTVFFHFWCKVGSSMYSPVIHPLTILAVFPKYRNLISMCTLILHLSSTGH